MPGLVRETYPMLRPFDHPAVPIVFVASPLALQKVQDAGQGVFRCILSTVFNTALSATITISIHCEGRHHAAPSRSNAHGGWRTGLCHASFAYKATRTLAALSGGVCRGGTAAPDRRRSTPAAMADEAVRKTED